MSREDRIADLEAALSAATGQCAALDKEKRALEAKLAEVMAWADRMPESYGMERDADLDAVLSGTRKPLAVVEGQIVEDDNGLMFAEALLPEFEWGDRHRYPVTVIVIPEGWSQ